MPSKALTQVRTLKARMEDERLPKGADKRRHLKLGRGSLSDVEWTVQLLQLQHAHTVPGLRTTSTLGSLDVAAQEGLIVPAIHAHARLRILGPATRAAAVRTSQERERESQ